MVSSMAAAPAPPEAAAPAPPEHKVAHKELCSHLDRREFRGTFLRSSVVLLQTVGLSAGWWLLAAAHGPEAGFLGKLALGFAWGLLVLRSYMIFHDCGHGSFYQGFRGAKPLNFLTMHLSAMLCGTPTDWNAGHQLHHANVGNMGQNDYDWGETIFHTAAAYVKLPAWQQRLWKVRALSAAVRLA